jgi:hypothetical protein
MERARHLLVVLPTVILFTGCGSTEPNGMHRVSVSAGVASASVQPAAGLSADLIIGGEGGSVSISSAQIVLSRIKLANNEPCADDEDDGDDMEDANGTAAVVSHGEPGNDENDEEHGENKGEDDEGCPPLKVGPVLVDLPLDGTTTVVLDAFVPAGTYTRLQTKLHAVKPDDEGVADFLAAHPEFEGISVKVVGVFTDAADADHEFTFTSRLNVVSTIKFDEPVTVGEGTTNLTIDVDLASWFTNASGGVIDPTNEANQHAIEKNIRRSLRAKCEVDD